jgi:pyroglutamyl-peptidase
MILVTGFGPYHEDSNASGELVRSLMEALPEDLVHLKDELVFEIITCDVTSRETESQSLEAKLEELLRRYDLGLCIFIGQAPGYNKVIIEKMAANTFMREVIDPDRPVAYWSNLPGTDSLPGVLEAQGIPAADSFYAGQHLCNHILYSSLYFAEKNGLEYRSGFIHIPVLPEQVISLHRNAAAMPLDVTRKALSLIINHVVEKHRHEQTR